MAGLDPGSSPLPSRTLGDAALTRARELGVSHADFRFERVRYQDVRVRDGALQGASDSEDLGFAVRVIHEGSWGFAGGRSPWPGSRPRWSPPPSSSPTSRCTTT